MSETKPEIRLMRQYAELREAHQKCNVTIATLREELADHKMALENAQQAAIVFMKMEEESQTQIARLREALEPLAIYARLYDAIDPHLVVSVAVSAGVLHRARVALADGLEKTTPRAPAPGERP